MSSSKQKDASSHCGRFRNNIHPSEIWKNQNHSNNPRAAAAGTPMLFLPLCLLHFNPSWCWNHSNSAALVIYWICCGLQWSKNKTDVWMWEGFLRWFARPTTLVQHRCDSWWQQTSLFGHSALPEPLWLTRSTLLPGLPFINPGPQLWASCSGCGAVWRLTPAMNRSDTNHEQRRWVWVWLMETVTGGNNDGARFLKNRMFTGPGGRSALH